MLTEFIVVDEDAVVRIPDHLSYEEAATLPCAGVTAWNSLNGGRCLRVGDTVLAQGTGGVSLFAVQFAKLAGARVIAITSNDEKATRLKALGADDVVNYAETPAWHRAVRDLTDGRGVDHIVDILGGSLEQSIRSIALGGQINYIGRLATGESMIDSNLLYKSVATVRVIFAGSRGHFVAMNRAIASNGLRPVIHRVFPFDETIAAFHYLEEVRPFGKVVVSHS
jgi:NADPH:quinone reductase-like Zn-dependent oxidoreductase